MTSEITICHKPRCATLRNTLAAIRWRGALVTRQP